MNRLLSSLAVLALLIIPLSVQAQLTSLLGTGEKVQVVLAGAKATADATVIANWIGDGGPATANVTTNGTTAVDVVVGAASAPPKTVQNIIVSNTDTAAITLTIQRISASTTYPIVKAVVLQVNDTLYLNPNGKYNVVDASGNERGTANASIVRTSQTYKVNSKVKAGTTAGWTVSAGNNLGTIATVAQSQTSSTLVVQIDGLHVGDTITGFSIYSSINSAGNTATLDANLRKLTLAAGATATDASVASITQVSVTAATASTATKGSLTEVVAAGTSYYILLTATTAASTTIELDSIEITVTSS